MTDERYYIGLDGGGSKTELLLAQRQGQELLTIVGPSANPQRLSVEQSAQVLTNLIQKALLEHPGIELSGICAGIAGAGNPTDQEAIAQALRQSLGAHAPPHIAIVHDGVIALEAAFEGESGLMVITGTGSVALARTQTGEVVRVGGWGYLLGDEGSGHAVGIDALRAVTDAFDGGPQTVLKELLAERHGIADRETLIDQTYQKKWPVQKMAPITVEAAEKGDEVAQQIVRHQTRLLARQVGWLADRCSEARHQVALMGGLTNEPYYRRHLREALLERLPGWEVLPPLHRPVVGAWRLAKPH